VQLSPIVTSSGCNSSIYTNWLIQTLLPITTPRSRLRHGRKLCPPGATKAILLTSLPSRGGKVNGSYPSCALQKVDFRHGDLRRQWTNVCCFFGVSFVLHNLDPRASDGEKDANSTPKAPRDDLRGLPRAPNTGTMATRDYLSVLCSILGAGLTLDPVGQACWSRSVVGKRSPY
jgi:hypothetical protein